MITILGDSGFVGSSLKKRLIQEGKECCGLSRPLFDLTKPSTFVKIPENTRILIHAAGVVGPGFPDEAYWRECVQSAYELTEFLNSERQLDLFMYASSGAVYKASEGALGVKSILKPESLYGMSRLLSENIITVKANCRTVMMRLFFPFGPGQTSPRLIPELFRKIVGNEKIPLNNEQGSPKINPIYIDDLLGQIMEILQKPDEQIVNLGGSEVVTIKQLAEIIGKVVGKKPVFEVAAKKTANLFCHPYQPSSLPLSNRLKYFLQEKI